MSIRVKTLTMFGVVSIRTSGPLWDGDLIQSTLRTRRAWAIQAYNTGADMVVDGNRYKRNQRAGKVKVMKFTLTPAGGG